MGRFWRFLNDLELKELHLHGRLFIWRNERVHPTLERIDRLFVSMEWEDRFPKHHLRCLSTDGSDHVPLVLNTNSQPLRCRKFHFEAIWPRLLGYLEMVTMAWSTTLHNADPCRVLESEIHRQRVTPIGRGQRGHYAPRRRPRPETTHARRTRAMKRTEAKEFGSCFHCPHNCMRAVAYSVPRRRQREHEIFSTPSMHPHPQ